MTSQPNTEDGNEWLDEILTNAKIPIDGYITDKNGNPIHIKKVAKQAITDYIQSNYILKSDVENIIKQSKPKKLKYTDEWNIAIDDYEDKLIKKASQYGLGGTNNNKE